MNVLKVLIYTFGIPELDRFTHKKQKSVVEPKIACSRIAMLQVHKTWWAYVKAEYVFMASMAFEGLSPNLPNLSASPQPSLL